ncbi:unnamed protein product [Ectocarpus sp. 12 AP-2014]
MCCSCRENTTQLHREEIPVRLAFFANLHPVAAVACAFCGERYTIQDILFHRVECTPLLGLCSRPHAVADAGPF